MDKMLANLNEVFALPSDPFVPEKKWADTSDASIQRKYGKFENQSDDIGWS